MAGPGGLRIRNGQWELADVAIVVFLVAMSVMSLRG